MATATTATVSSLVNLSAIPSCCIGFGDEGFLSCFNSRTGDEIFRRRIDHGGGSANIGLALAIGANGTFAACTYYGDLFVIPEGL